mgnify:FL=1
MLLDSTVLSKSQKLEIDSLVGSSYSIWDSLRLKGIGSSKLNIESYSEKFRPFLEQNNSLNYCNIELRPKGIIVHINKRASRFSWVMPYYALSIFSSEHLGIHSNGQFLKIKHDDLYTKSVSFIQKVMSLKAHYSDQTNPMKK